MQYYNVILFFNNSNVIFKIQELLSELILINWRIRKPLKIKNFSDLSKSTYHRSHRKANYKATNGTLTNYAQKK